MTRGLEKHSSTTWRPSSSRWHVTSHPANFVTLLFGFEMDWATDSWVFWSWAPLRRKYRAFFAKEEPWHKQVYSQIYLQVLAAESTSKKSFWLKSKRRAFVNLEMRIWRRCWAFCSARIAVVVPDLWANIFIRGYPLILKSTLPLGQAAWTLSPGAWALWCCVEQQSKRKHMKDCKTLYSLTKVWKVCSGVAPKSKSPTSPLTVQLHVCKALIVSRSETSRHELKPPASQSFLLY